ncbi:MAG: hypothetical protein DMF78_21980 [Acidobacteria bacterium]|nr:MAG: hypothetical protein DMF78_21980 [Acidobacteriota bacterium]
MATRANAPLSSDLDDPTAVPYFLWDQTITVAELRDRLASPDPDVKAYWMGKLLREARDVDVWRFTSPQEVAHWWPRIVGHLGRRRPFWEFLFGLWRDLGLLPASEREREQVHHLDPRTLPSQ